MIRLYDFHLSGNAHKARNLLSLLGVEHERVTVDLTAGEQRTDEFLELNPFAQVPVLVDGDVVVRDSSAVLVYLAAKFGGDAWLPADAESTARVQEWLATTQTAIADGPGLARLITLFGVEGDLDAARERAHAVLARIDAHLGRTDFLVGNAPTVADIAAYSYIALAPDGGVELDAYANVRRWIAALEALPKFEPAPVQQN